jgi:uncharacterized protein DUF5658
MNWNIGTWSIKKKVALAFLCILQVADFASTLSATAVSGVVELNPLVNNAVAGLDVHRLLLFKLIAMVLAFLLISRTKKMWRVWTVCGIYSAIVLSNTLLAFK